MTRLFRSLGALLGGPYSTEEKRSQVAALCYRTKGADKEVLLITSRDTARWILPKGWPIEGKDAAGSAMQEAWEEAGVRTGKISSSLGTFDYQKRLDDGQETTCETQVFPIEVEHLAKDFPGRKQRRRKWVTTKKAATMVQEPELQDILLAF